MLPGPARSGPMRRGPPVPRGQPGSPARTGPARSGPMRRGPPGPPGPTPGRDVCPAGHSDGSRASHRAPHSGRNGSGPTEPGLSVRRPAPGRRLREPRASSRQVEPEPAWPIRGRRGFPARPGRGNLHHGARNGPARRGGSHGADAQRAARQWTMQNGRTRPSLAAWPSRPCSRFRALSRARRPGPLPLLSCLGPGRGYTGADRRYGWGAFIAARSSGAHQLLTRFRLGRMVLFLSDGRAVPHGGPCLNHRGPYFGHRGPCFIPRGHCIPGGTRPGGGCRTRPVLRDGSQPGQVERSAPA